MKSNFLTEDTKAIIMLCGVFGKDRLQRPLSLAEYSSLVRWLIGAKMRPSDLLQKDIVAEASNGVFSSASPLRSGSATVSG